MNIEKAIVRTMAYAGYRSASSGYSVDAWVTFMAMAKESVSVDVTHNVDVRYRFDIATINAIMAAIDDQVDG